MDGWIVWDPRIAGSPDFFATVAEWRGATDQRACQKLHFLQQIKVTGHQDKNITNDLTKPNGNRPRQHNIANIISRSSDRGHELWSFSWSWILATGAIIELLRRYCYCHGQKPGIASDGWSSWLQIWCETALSRALFSPSWNGHSGTKDSGLARIVFS